MSGSKACYLSGAAPLLGVAFKNAPAIIKRLAPLANIENIEPLLFCNLKIS